MPKLAGRRRHERDRHAFDRDSDRATLRPLDHRDDQRQPLERVEHRRRIGRRDDGCEHARRVDPAARVPCDLAAERVRDRADELARLGEHEAARRPLLGAARQPLDQLALGGSADAAHGAQPAAERCGPELLGRPHVERLADLEHALRADADQPSEADQLGTQLALQVVELGDPARRDKLVETGRDAGADPSQLPHTPGADELLDPHRRLPHRAGGSAVGPRRVGVGPREIEQRRERFQSLRDARVVEGVRHARKSAGCECRHVTPPPDGCPTSRPRRPGRVGRSHLPSADTQGESPRSARAETEGLRPDPRLRGHRRRPDDRARRARRLDRLALPAGRRLAVGLRPAARCVARRLVRAVSGRAVRERARLRARLERARHDVPDGVGRRARNRRADARRRTAGAAARGRPSHRRAGGPRADALARRAALRLRRDLGAHRAARRPPLRSRRAQRPGCRQLGRRRAGRPRRRGHGRLGRRRGNARAARGLGGAHAARSAVAAVARRGPAREDTPLLAGLERGSRVRRAVARRGRAQRARAEAARLRAVGRDRRGPDDVAARAPRRRPQLGLPLRLAPRCELHARRADPPRLPRGGAGLLLVADECLAPRGTRGCARCTG